MATIKSYSDLQQSRKLAKILPLESADMYYEEVCNLPKAIIGNYVLHNQCMEDKDYKKLSNSVLSPAWSLAALLGVLPNNEDISTNLSKGGYRISTLEYTNSWFVDYEDETNSLNNCVTSADNPVDACYEMILKLNELEML